VVIALSHGGVIKGADGRYTDGEDVQLAKDVPDIDVVISGHSHTELQDAIMVNGRTPVVQTGRESRNLGELVITVDGDKLTVEAYLLHPIDDTRESALAVEDPLGELVHRDASRRLLEVDENVVPALGDADGLFELGVEHIEQRQRALEEEAPGAQPLGRRA